VKVVSLLFAVLTVQGSGQTIADGSRIYVDNMDGFGRFVVAALKSHAPRITPVLLEDNLAGESGFRITGESTNFRAARYEPYARIKLLDSRGSAIWSYSCRKARPSFLQMHGSADPAKEDMRLAAKDIAKHLKKLIGTI